MCYMACRSNRCLCGGLPLFLRNVSGSVGMQANTSGNILQQCWGVAYNKTCTNETESWTGWPDVQEGQGLLSLKAVAADGNTLSGLDLWLRGTPPVRTT